MLRTAFDSQGPRAHAKAAAAAIILLGVAGPATGALAGCSLMDNSPSSSSDSDSSKSKKKKEPKAGAYDGRYEAWFLDSFRENPELFADEEELELYNMDKLIEQMEEEGENPLVILEIDGEECELSFSDHGDPDDIDDEADCTIDYEDKTLEVDGEEATIEFKNKNTIIVEIPFDEDGEELPVTFKKVK